MIEAIEIGDKLLIHDHDGHRMFLDTEELHMTIHMLEQGEWEPQIREIILAGLKAGDAYMDIGANVGFHAVYAAGLVGASGNIICVEPNKRVFQILKSNMDINGFLQTSCLFQKAVSNSTGTGTLKLYEGHAGGSGLGASDEFGEACTEEMVELDTLDSIVSQSGIEFDRIKVLKIDVEGFELSVLQGGSKVLKNPELVVILEWDLPRLKERMGADTPDNILRIMKENGFCYLYLARYMMPLKKISYEEALKAMGDLIFSKEASLNALTVETIIRKEIEEEASRLELETELNNLKNDLLFSRNAFYEAVEVQEDLKKKIYYPGLKDWLRCCKYFVKGKKK